MTAAIKNSFPDGLSQPALRALGAAGYASLDELAGVSEAELRGLHGMGPAGIRIIVAALNASGLALRTAMPIRGSNQCR
ncbi:MAG: DNA-binding protein [Gemmatimonadota bacterium]|nr:DNA-binding protein [Gemmatimonadota bacterium]